MCWRRAEATVAQASSPASSGDVSSPNVRTGRGRPLNSQPRRLRYAKAVLRLCRRSRTSRRTRFATLHVDNALPVGHSRAMAKPALGRGLGALLSGSPPAAKAPPAPVLATPQTAELPIVDAREGIERVPLARIRPCPLQPRK